MRWSKPDGRIVGMFFVCALASSLAPAPAIAVDVAKWSTYDIDLTASGSSGNWYTDPNGSVVATFTGPGGITQTVSGFWNGNNTFAIRFTPTVEGSWTYTTTSANSGLNNQTGTIDAVAAADDNHGFLRSDPTNPTAFAWEDGTHYFMWGQIYDDIVQTAMVNDNWKTAIDNSLAHGMSKIRMNIYPDSASPGWTGNDSDWSTLIHGYPYTVPYTGTSMSPDRDQLNLDYWQKLDEVVSYIESKGMVADLSITNPYNANNMYGTDTQNDRFVNYAVSRYAAYHNVIWNVSWEWNLSPGRGGAYPQNQADYERLARSSTTAIRGSPKARRCGRYRFTPARSSTSPSSVRHGRPMPASNMVSGRTRTRTGTNGATAASSPTSDTTCRWSTMNTATSATTATRRRAPRKSISDVPSGALPPAAVMAVRAIGTSMGRAAPSGSLTSRETGSTSRSMTTSSTWSTSSPPRASSIGKCRARIRWSAAHGRISWPNQDASTLLTRPPAEHLR